MGTTTINLSVATREFKTLEDFGAVGDGTTDDSTAIQNAVNSGVGVLILNKTYLTNSQITVPDDAMITGMGNDSVIKTTSDISVFKIEGSNCNFTNFRILGNKTGSNQKGVDITGFVNTIFYISNVFTSIVFDTLTSGFYTTQNVGNYEGGANLVNCIAKGCGTGFYFDERGEYCNSSNCNAIGNDVGVDIRAGNTVWTGGNITENDIGLYVGGGSNNGHGVVSDAKINHNITYNLECRGVSRGMNLKDIMLFAGNVIITSTIGVDITGVFEVGEFRHLSSTKSKVGIVFRDNPTTFFITSTDVDFSESTFLDGAGVPSQVIPFMGTKVITENAAPSDTPTIVSEKAPMRIDSANERLYGYVNGNWLYTPLSTEILVSSGNIGLGESSPVRKLHVNSGNVNEAAIFESTDSGSYIEFKDSNTSTKPYMGALVNELVFIADKYSFWNGGRNVVIDSSGNMGVGQDSPTEKLEVNGKIKATDINFTGLPTSSSGLSAGDVWNDGGTLKIV